jgi:aminopeptidase-like protein
VPYVTSYYHRDWGFCMSYNKFKNLKSGEYNVVIDSKLDKKGNLIIGEYLIKGKSKKEILISTNICHPSLVNNELTGPSILTYLIKKLKMIITFIVLELFLFQKQ